MASSSSSSSSANKATAQRIQDLLKIDEEKKHPKTPERLDELRRIFIGLKDDLQTSGNSSSKSSTQQKWQIFLKASFQQFVDQLVDSIQNQNQLWACRLFWGVLAHFPSPSSSSSSKNHTFVHVELLTKFVHALAQSQLEFDNNQRVRHVILNECLEPFRDVQYYTMVAIVNLAFQQYHHTKKKLIDDDQEIGSENENDDDDKIKNADDTTIIRYADRLVGLLLLIPLAQTQQELDESAKLPTGGYLFPPPAEQHSRHQPNEESSSAEDQSSDDEEEEDNQEEEEDEDKEDDDKSLPEQPRKRAKTNTAFHRRRNNVLVSYQNIRRHHKMWSKAWLAVLKLPVSESTLKMILRFLPKHVLPLSPHPLRFADFYMHAYNHDASDTTTAAVVVPMLALEGLFWLMTQKGLEYPNFYKQLYALVHEPQCLFLKHRRTFLSLLERCLVHNGLLPAHVTAAFVKILVRNCLSIPPNAICVVLALCSNVLVKHPAILCLLHRNKRDDGLEDGFDATTRDPEEANALSSSLWELEVLERHYYPAVVTLAQSMGRLPSNSTPLYKLSDEFLPLTYTSLFEQERKRKAKQKTTPLTFQKPTGLFSDSDVFAGILAVPKK